MNIKSCDIGGDYLYGYGYGAKPVYQEPCSATPTHRYRSDGMVEGHWSHRCATHVRWLNAPGLVVEPLAGMVIEHQGRELRVIPMDQHDRRCNVRVASAQGTTPELLHCHFCGFCHPKSDAAAAASAQAKEASRG